MRHISEYRITTESNEILDSFPIAVFAIIPLTRVFLIFKGSLERFCKMYVEY